LRHSTGSVSKACGIDTTRSLHGEPKTPPHPADREAIGPQPTSADTMFHVHE